MEKTFSEELNDMALDVEKNRAGVAKRLQNQKRLLLAGLIVMFCAIILGPKIGKSLAEHDKWLSEHSPSIAVIFEDRDYLKCVKEIKKIDQPHYGCFCSACRFERKTNGQLSRDEIWVITQSTESLLQKQGLRYQRKDIGYKKECHFDSFDVASENFVNW